jgi:hypothetical protein
MNELRQEITYLQQENKILRDELAVYRWRDKKAVILKELGLTRYLTTYNRAEIINAYETNRLFALIEALFINKEADDLLSNIYQLRVFDPSAKHACCFVKSLISSKQVRTRRLCVRQIAYYPRISYYAAI